MATKCKLNINDVVNDLWDSMQTNKAGNLDNDRVNSQARLAGKLLKGKADQLRNRKMSGLPESIPFYEE